MILHRIALNGFGIGAKLLTQAHRYGILQMGAAGFNHIIKLDGFGLQGSAQILQHSQQFIQPPKAAQPQCGGNHIVGGLRHVDVVIGMDSVLAQLPTQDLSGPVGDDFVDIHIVTGAGARLEGIHDKLIIPFAIDHFLGSFQDGVGAFYIQQAQVQVDLCSSALDHRHGPDERPPGFQA